jgi:hypothetical protein
MAHFFDVIFRLYLYWIFVKRDKILSKKIKYKYENIKLKKRMPSGRCLTSKLYDKIIKMPSKSHETIPLNGDLLHNMYCMHSTEISSVPEPHRYIMRTPGARKKYYSASSKTHILWLI